TKLTVAHRGNLARYSAAGEPLLAFAVAVALHSEVNQMKHTAVALTLATFLVAGTPVLAKPTPSAPPTYLPSVVMPYDAYAPLFLAPMPEPRKHTGASNPDTPDPTRITPGAEAKS